MINKKDFEAIIGLIIDIVVGILKWVYLFLTIITLGLGVSYLIIVIVKNTGLQDTLVAQLTSYVTFYSESEAYSLIESIGCLKVVVSSLVYAFVTGITYALIYFILDKYLVLIKSIEKREKPDNKKLDIIKKCVYASFFAAIINPLCVTITFLTTSSLGMENISFTGVFFLIMSFTIYLLYSSMYELSHENKKLHQEVDTLNALATDEKIKKIKKNSKRNKNKKNYN